MSIKIKAGTTFVLPVEFDDPNFEHIEAVEFIFKQDEGGETLKTAYWSKSGEARDAELVEGTTTIVVTFRRDETYEFMQNELFQLDTRIHYENAVTNPYTNILRVRMSNTLFERGEEVNA